MQPEIAGIPTANIALAVSLLSLVASTGVSIFVARRDRANIEVRVSQRELVINLLQVGPLLQFEAANAGRRPVRLANYGLEYGDMLYQLRPFPSTPLPQTLTEGDSYIGYYALRRLQEEHRQKKARLLGFYFLTADNRIYRQHVSPRSAVYELLQTAPLVPAASNLEQLEVSGISAGSN